MKTKFIAGNLEDVQEVIEDGVDINLPNDDGMTALHLAVLKSILFPRAQQLQLLTMSLCFDLDRVEMVELLLERKANVKVVDNDGNTPLHMVNTNNGKS